MLNVVKSALGGKPLFFILFIITISSCNIPADELSYRMETLPYSQYFDTGTLFVVASFDGCRELNRWWEILDFAKKNDIKFTFFISANYFIPEKDKMVYYDPVNTVKEGYSRIGFGGTAEEVKKRREFVLQAINEGHDIQSHLCGHFDGKNWNEEDWRIEFDEFNEICSFLPEPVQHIRFPLLAMNKYVYPVMAEFNFYSIMSVDEDESDKFNRVTITYKNEPASFLEFPIGYVQEGSSKVLMMDYNFFVHDKRNKVSPLKAQQKMIDIYIREADRCFLENYPLFISHHFSVVENNDAYWKAMKKVLLTLKVKYPVKFLTVTELYEKCKGAEVYHQ